MKKLISKIVSTLACTALCATGTAFPYAQNTPVVAENSTVVTANSVTSSPTTVDAELLLPSSYEQYLSLTAPADVSATNGAIAIADGKSMYVFNRAENIYREYTHASHVQKVALDENDTLYFLSDLYLYKLTAENLKNGDSATPLGIACKGLFAIYGDVLCYYASNNALKFYSLSLEEEIREVTLPAPLQSESPLAFGRDGLYCVCESNSSTNEYTVYAINLQTYLPTAVTKVGEKLRSLTIANHLLCLATQSGDFYSYNLTDLSANERADSVDPITFDESGYIALCSLNADVYAVRENVVRHYAYTPDGAAFTEYEIGASSTSPHRLNGATELVLNEERLFIADCDNQRISVYDVETNLFETAIATNIRAEYLASYQNTLLVTSQEEATVYSLAKRTYGESILTLSSDDVKGKIVGVASVYGRYYVLTEDNYCYMLSKESGDWAWTETHKNTQTLRAVAFTADVYGSLYVAYDDDTVYRFAEKQLLDGNERGELVLANLQSPEKIAVDYQTNFYALQDGTLQKYTKSGGMYALTEEFSPNYHLVKEETPSLQSFAFGMNSPYTYFLYEGDYIVKTDELQIPQVSPVPVGNAAELIFGETQAEFSVVTVEMDAILIEFDVSLLQQETEFPYVSFERTQTEQKAMKIGEEGEYSILAIAKQRTGAYKTCLVATSSCQELEKAEYKTDYENAKDGYITNAVSLYKFPYLNETLTLATIPSGTKVKLLGEVIKLDHAYYQIQLTDENGAQQIGFIPTAYATLFDGSTPAPEEVIMGATETDVDAVWRCAFLVMGFGAIIVLVDFLLLRERNDEEE